MESAISWREQSVIDDNPYFMPDNYDMILKFWKFDTEDKDLMLRIFRDFRDMKLSQREVLDFAKSIGFDVSSLRQ